MTTTRSLAARPQQESVKDYYGRVLQDTRDFALPGELVPSSPSGG